MRKLAILLLLALMPLRLWASDAMAVKMALGGQAEVSQSEAKAHAAAMADMPDDCPMKRMAAEAQGQDDGAKPSCQACNLCAVSIVQSSPLLVFPSTAAAMPDAARASFASAFRAPDLRPPILLARS